MIVMLARLLRYSLVTDKIFVTVGEDLEFLSKYVELLKLRYRKFEAHWDVDGAILNQPILRFCLQPLIENSVYHGIGPKENGNLYIRAKLTKGNLVFAVEDDGVGISPERLEEQKAQLLEWDFNPQKLGIKNTYQRLKLIYGERSDMRLESKEGEFTRITITIASQESQ